MPKSGRGYAVDVRGNDIRASLVELLRLRASAGGKRETGRREKTAAVRGERKGERSSFRWPAVSAAGSVRERNERRPAGSMFYL